MEKKVVETRHGSCR